MKRLLPLLAVPFAFASPAEAQVEAVAAASGEETVFDGDWLAVGAGGVYMPSYDGSDDYVITPIPIVQGNLFGIGINPRQGGVVLDLIPNPDEGVNFSAGPSIRLRANRASQVKDPVVKLLPERDRALEVGPSVGITIPKVLHAYDSLSFGGNVSWDVLGAHKGMVIEPSITYFTPLSKGIAVALTVDAEYGNDRFMDYYYSITPADTVASGLSTYDAEPGFTRVGGRILAGIDLNGDLTDGGLSLIVLGGYSRMLGDAKRSPIVADRGSADQFMGALGLGYVF